MSRSIALLESRISIRTCWHFLVLTDAHGRAVGECSDSGDVPGLVRWLDSAAPVLESRDLLDDRDELVATLRAKVAKSDPVTRFAAATGLGGVEQMLLDLAAKNRGEPLWKWLDSAAPAPIPIYANVNRMPGGRTPADVAGMAAAAVAAGFSALKCAPFDEPEPGRALAQVALDRVRAVREAVGDDVTLRVDCHERLPVEDVHALLGPLEELGVAWLEDAVGIGEVDQLVDLKAATRIPLAGGESMFDSAEAQAAVDRGVIDVLMPDVKHAGGIEQVLRIARSVPQVSISPHNPSGPVATAASAQLFGACPNTTVLEYAFGEVDWRSELVGGHELVVGGELHVDDRPGLGVDLDTSHPSIRTVWSALV